MGSGITSGIVCLRNPLGDSDRALPWSVLSSRGSLRLRVSGVCGVCFYEIRRGCPGAYLVFFRWSVFMTVGCGYSCPG